jgi:mono/diheme cytochrome c family protein
MTESNFEKQGYIEAVIGTIAVAVIIVVLSFYALTEPQRIENSKQQQITIDLNVAMNTYAANCSVCHGISGEGIGAIPALNKPALKESDPEVVVKIISRGLFKTQMPAWAKSDGGPLSDYQIEQVVTLIRFGNWEETRDRVVNLGMAPKVPFSSIVDPEILIELKKKEGGEVLANGVTLFAAKCVACHGGDGLGTDLAPALNDPKVRGKSLEELKRIVTLGVPGTLMAGWESSLSGSELNSVISLIKKWDEVPRGAVPIIDTPIPVTSESIAQGSSLYTNNCSTCHGPDGQGRGRRVPPLRVKGFLTKTNDRAIEQIITLGKPDTPMPAWGDRMTKVEIQAIVGFLRSWETTAPEVAVPVRGRGPWWRTGEQTNIDPGSSNLGRSSERGRGKGRRGQGRGKGRQGQQAAAGESQDIMQHEEMGATQQSFVPQPIRRILGFLEWKAFGLIAGLSIIALLLIVFGIRGFKKSMEKNET